MQTIKHAVIRAMGGPTKAAILFFGDAKKQSRVSNWLLEDRDIPADIKIMSVIEAHTNFTRYDVLPDVYGKAPRAAKPKPSAAKAA